MWNNYALNEKFILNIYDQDNGFHSGLWNIFHRMLYNGCNYLYILIHVYASNKLILLYLYLFCFVLDELKDHYENKKM